MATMKITVVGGNGGTGAEVVRIAAERGHHVTSLSRTRTPAPRAGVREVVGDALNPDRVQDAVAGADAVVVTVGGSSKRDRHRTEVTRSVVAAMQDAGVRRLIVQSSLGVGDSMELLPGPARVFAKAALGRALADHAEQEAAVAASGLDWTVVRPGGLTDGPETGSVVVQETAERRRMKSRISRADVATYIVEALGDPATFGRLLSMRTP